MKFLSKYYTLPIMFITEGSIYDIIIQTPILTLVWALIPFVVSLFFKDKPTSESYLSATKNVSVFNTIMLVFIPIKLWTMWGQYYAFEILLIS